MSDQDPFDGHDAPGNVLRRLLDARGWSQEQLAAVTGRSRQTVIQIMQGRAGITPEMAVVLGAAFGNSPNDWMRLESNYRLSRVKGETQPVQRRAKIYGKIPIREAQRRGWIENSSDPDRLESELNRFLRIVSIDNQPNLSVAPRRSGLEPELTPAQLAWCARARELGEILQVAPYDPGALPKAEREMRELAAYPKEVRHLPKLLAKYGVRFVVIEPLPSGKLDGATLWLDERSPVIAVSVRYDRIDSFWHTVFHELVHVRRQDALVVDTAIEAGTPRMPLEPDEDRANREAAAALVPQDQLESFIRRLSPLYPAQRIIQFAHKVRMHPGIIVGQLQHRDEVGYSAHRGLLVKIRSLVTETALTDGWGHSVPSLS
jgi:HTH-type transcriptional regulator / antitoxin HigA